MAKQAMKWMVLFCVLVSSVSSKPLPSVSANNPEFLIHPQSVNATEGSIVKFTCTITRADGVAITSTWRPELYTYYEQSYEQLGPDTFRGNLILRVSAIDNRTFAWCSEHSHTFKNTKTYLISNPATIYIQGPLARVGDLVYRFMNINTILITWTPPFTLPGTHILGYNVSIAVRGQNRIREEFTTDPHYMLHLSNDAFNEICAGIVLWVSGYNGLNGMNEHITIQFSQVLHDINNEQVPSQFPVFVQDYFKIAYSENLCDSNRYTGHGQNSPTDTEISGSGLIDETSGSGLIELENLEELQGVEGEEN